MAPPNIKGVYYSWVWDGAVPTSFNEAPMLAALVAQGKLPALADRIPTTNPYVLPPAEKIGVYGGIDRIVSPRSRRTGTQTSLGWSTQDGNGISRVPGIGSQTNSPDGKVYTFTLREGLHFRNGENLDIESVKFAWEQYNQNRTLNPLGGEQYYRDPISGEEPTFAVVDANTWTLTFDTGSFALELRDGRGCSSAGRYCWFLPVDFMKPFHPDFADPAAYNALLSANDDDETKAWASAFSAPDVLDRPPLVGPYFATLSSDTLDTWDRNPYFPGVDPAGNQLPYTDGAIGIKTESASVAVFRTIAGEADLVGGHLAVSQLPLYRANQEKGDYRILLWPSPSGADTILPINQDWNKDPYIGSLLRTKDFRLALAAGIDRVAINETVFLGLGSPNNGACPAPATPYYPGAAACALNIDFDLAKGNRLLDGLGLTAKDSDGFRLRGDGSGNRISLPYGGGPAGQGEAGRESEIIWDGWAKLGIDVDLVVIQRPGFEIRQSNVPMLVANGMTDWDWQIWNSIQSRLAPMGQSSLMWPMFGKFLQTDGREGIPKGPDPNYLPLAPADTWPGDPDGLLKELERLRNEGVKYGTFSPERVDIGKQIFQLHAENQWAIGLVGFFGVEDAVIIARNNLRNPPNTIAKGRGGKHRELYYFIGGVGNYSPE
jgi:peptide/nickel transport system substrate-binding protein